MAIVQNNTAEEGISLILYCNESSLNYLTDFTAPIVEKDRYGFMKSLSFTNLQYNT